MNDKLGDVKMLKKYNRIVAFFLTFVFVSSIFFRVNAIEETQLYDVVIKGGTIYNPSTEHILENYNIGINGSKIVRITKEEIIGDNEIDAEGLVVSPGFIDLVSYDPNYIGIEFKVLDGVTSNLAMHGGTEDAESWYASWENNGVITNFGASSFITRLRWPIVGTGIDAEMTDPADIERLVEETRKNIENGALGISFSFEYVPGIKHEIKPLLELAAEYNVPTFYHLRYSDKENGLKGIQEVIDYGRETGAAIHIMHINSTGGTFVMDEALQMVHDARESGLDITTDFYPYDYWATYIDSARFRPGWQERYNITYEDLQIAATDIRITEETFDQYRTQHILVAAHGSMPEEELIMLLQDPHTMIGSDTIIEPHMNNHPRGAGTYSRLFGKYVRDEKVLSMMDAIKKVTYFPAKRMEDAAPSMHYKGRIEIGADADITIFNLDTIIDKATVEAPGTASVGVEYVLVNGVIVKDKDGLVDVERPGKPIYSYFVDKTMHNEPIEFQLTLDDDTTKIENVYEMDDKLFLPINNIFEQIGTTIHNSPEGYITVGDSLSFEVGSNVAFIDDDAVTLDEEIILYKEDIYISLDSFKQSIANDYDVKINESERNIILTSKSVDHKESMEDDEDSSEKEEQIEDGINTIMFILGALLIICIIVFIVIKRRK